MSNNNSTFRMRSINDTLSEIRKIAEEPELLQTVYDNGETGEIILLGEKPFVIKNQNEETVVSIDDESIKTTVTLFTNDQELVSKKYVDDTVSTVPTLQSAYDSGNTIATANTLPVEITGTEGVNFNSNTLTTAKTAFTDDQELVSKKYVYDTVSTVPTLQSVYDSSVNGTIELDNLNKAFTIQQTSAGDNLLSVNNSGVSIQSDIEIIGINNSLKIQRLTDEAKINSEDTNNVAQNLTLRGADIIIDGTTKINTGGGQLTLFPSTTGTIGQALLSDGSNGVTFNSVKKYNLVFAGTGVSPSNSWLIYNGNGNSVVETTQTFSTKFYAPFNMTCDYITFSREVTGSPITTVKVYEAGTFTEVYSFEFLLNVAIDLVPLPGLTLTGGQEYVVVATDTTGGSATVKAEFIFTY